MSFIFVEFLIIALLALGITFILFHYLDAYAEGQGKVLGGTIKYGGSLAGFALVTLLLSNLYSNLIKSAGKTEVGSPFVIEVDGQYKAVFDHDSVPSKEGLVRIIQKAGDPYFKMTGRLKDFTFSSDIGYINDNRRMMYVYENDQGDMGIAMGNIVKDRPDTILMSYYDLYGFDVDFDTIGLIKLIRLPDPTD